MKRILSISTLLFFIGCATAQQYQGITVYGYRQPVITGAIPQVLVNEKNESASVEVKPRNNTWIYITLPQTLAIKNLELYINGKKYAVKQEIIANTPVTHTNYTMPDNPVTTELVPKTSKKVLLLMPEDALMFTPDAALKKRLAANEVVVGYTLKGKKYYSPLAKLVTLQAAVRQ